MYFEHMIKEGLLWVVGLWEYKRTEISWCVCKFCLTYILVLAILITVFDLIWSPPGQNGWHFTGNIFRCIFMNEKFCILIPNSLKFVPKCPIDNMSALVQVMAWHQIGNKPLPEPMLIQFTDAYMRHLGRWVKRINSNCKIIHHSCKFVRFRFRLFQSLWDLTGNSAAVLPRCLSNFRVI